MEKEYSDNDHGYCHTCTECAGDGASWDSEYQAMLCTPCFMRLEDEFNKAGGAA